MSQHIIRVVVEGQELEVQLGWDTPMQWYYLVISPIDDNGEINEPVYSNLDDVKPEGRTLDYYLSICENMDIKIPTEMVNSIRMNSVESDFNLCQSW